MGTEALTDFDPRNLGHCPRFLGSKSVSASVPIMKATPNNPHRAPIIFRSVRGSSLRKIAATNAPKTAVVPFNIAARLMPIRV